MDKLRDLPQFTVAIGRKLRGCDLVRLRDSDLVMGGLVPDCVSIVQSKIRRPFPIEVSENTRRSVGERVKNFRHGWLRFPVPEPIPSLSPSLDAQVCPSRPRLVVGERS